jgi:flotillin
MLIVAVVIGAIVVLAVIFKLVWRTAGPNEALVISGLGADVESPGFRVATGKGTMVLPGLQSCHRLSLDPRVTDLEVSCVTSEGATVGVRGVVGYKVGDDPSSIANAARRFRSAWRPYRCSSERSTTSTKQGNLDPTFLCRDESRSSATVCVSSASI